MNGSFVSLGDLEFSSVQTTVSKEFAEIKVSAWLSFSGRIETMEWGKSTYTVLPIPDEISIALENAGAKRVEVELNDHPFNMALTKSPAFSGTFIYAGKTTLRAAGISPGEQIEVRLRKSDPSSVEVPEDVMLAIRAGGASDDWLALTPGKQRGLLHVVNTAKRQDTRAKRIARLVSDLRG